MKQKFSFFSIVMYCISKWNGLLNKKKWGVGLDLIHLELIGSLWFAIAVISCDLKFVYLMFWMKSYASCVITKKSVSHNPSEIMWFGDQDTFLINRPNVKKSCVSSYLIETDFHDYFINRTFKRTVEADNLNVFSVTFYG